MNESASLSFKDKRELFQRFSADQVDNDSIRQCSRPVCLPVSFIQEQVIGAELVGLYDPKKIRVNCPSLCYLIKGSINISILDKTLCEIVRRHEILRTSYGVAEKQIFQIINDPPDNILQVTDLRGMARETGKNEAERILAEITSNPFSFFDNPLMISATLIITGDDESILIVVTNHIATDGLSMMVLQSELFVLYQAFLFNTPSPFPELPIQYADFAIWERNRYSDEFLEKKLAYWRNIPGTTNTFLPMDRIPTSLSYVGDIVPVTILPELVKRLMLLGRDCSATLFTVLFSAFILLIHVFSGYKCNFFCMPVANRARKETHSLIGCFMNFQFVHIDMEGNPTFVELVERVGKTLLDVYDNYIPFHFITASIPPQGPVVDFQLYTAMDLAAPSTMRDVPTSDSNALKQGEVISAPASQLQAGSFAAIPFKLSQQSEFALFPIDVFLSGTSGGINGHFRYQTAIYDRATILKLVNDYVVLLMKLVRNPALRIRETGVEEHESISADRM